MENFDIESTSSPETTSTPESTESTVIDDYSAFHDDLVLLQTINGAILFTLCLFFMVYIIRGLFTHD